MWFSPHLLLLASVAAQQNGDVAEFYECPETNGKFADPEQCDLFYICRKGIPTIEYCPEGLLFDTTHVNREKCVLPHNVDCGAREFVQEPSPDRDPRCPKANGVFDYDDESVCNKYLQCDNGRVFEFPCPNPLVFDVKVGSCVRSAQKSELARVCDVNQEFLEVDGFTCPTNGDGVGPQNLVQAHPIYPHPTDCQYYFSCYHGQEPNKFGCPQGNVFDAESQVCKIAEEVTLAVSCPVLTLNVLQVAECACWYGCPEDSKCGDDCNADCSCGSPVL